MFFVTQPTVPIYCQLSQHRSLEVIQGTDAKFEISFTGFQSLLIRSQTAEGRDVPVPLYQHFIAATTPMLALT